MVDYPTALDNISNPTATQTQAEVSHSEQHINANDAIEALEAKVGVDSSAVTTSLDYKLTNASSEDPGHTHTLAAGATDVTASAAEVNIMDGVTSTAAELNILDGVTANKDEINVLDGIPATLTATELGYVDGVTAAIQDQINGKQASLSKATAAEVATGTDDAKYTTALAVAPYANNSMARQAIMNGNFDVWQRGTSFTNPADSTHTADRFLIGITNTGTLPTNVVNSRQLLTSGDIDNSFYHYRIAPDGAGSGFGAADRYEIRQRIEHGTRLLCGASKTVTLSFWARSSIANKKLGYFAFQTYGTTGSPSASEAIVGDKVTLTSTWTKYTHTFTTNTLASKTFGTDNNDFFQISFVVMWGTGTFGDRVNSSGAGETFVGSGNIDIAQVQVCAGSVALPFQPKNYEDELRACQRYYTKIGGDDLFELFGAGHCSETTQAQFYIAYPTTMRAIPTMTTSGTASHFGVRAGAAAVAASAVPSTGTNGVGKNSTYLVVTVASGLTQGQGAILRANNTASAWLAFSAEL